MKLGWILGRFQSQTVRRMLPHVRKPCLLWQQCRVSSLADLAVVVAGHSYCQSEMGISLLRMLSRLAVLWLIHNHATSGTKVETAHPILLMTNVPFLCHSPPVRYQRVKSKIMTQLTNIGFGSLSVLQLPIHAHVISKK